MSEVIEPSDHGYMYDPTLRKIPRVGAPDFETDGRWIGCYTYEENRLIINDAVWGRCEIGSAEGDEVLLELAENIAVVRLLNVEQLTLDRLTQTIPGTAQFSRYEHLWGSVVFTRKMIEKYAPELDARSSLILQLRTFVSDLAHTSGSHRGDWMFQGMSGPENQHDIELMHLLEVSGVNDVLRKHSIDPSEVIFPNIEDWIECPSPDLCVDRVDYGAREIKRWLNITSQIEFAARPEAFAVIDDQLVMTSEQHALNFAKAFLLLPTEHWNEPVHRLLLRLDQELVKRLFTADGPALAASFMDGPTDYHPRDYMYTVDRDITMEMRFRDPFLNSVRPMMEDIAQAKRRIFAWERKSQLSSFFSSFGDPRFPDPVEPYDILPEQSLSIIPGNIDILQVESAEDISDIYDNAHSVDFNLPSMKPRAIDPLFVDGNGAIRRLSESNPSYAQHLAQQAEILRRSYVARLYVNPDVKSKIEKGLEENERLWPDALERPRMDAERFKLLLKESANLAINGSFVVLEGESLYR